MDLRYFKLGIMLDQLIINLKYHIKALQRNIRNFELLSKDLIPVQFEYW